MSEAGAGNDDTAGQEPASRPPRFVPDRFAVPTALVAGGLRLEPLGPQHNAADYAAWTGSIEHIRATPGFSDGNWPDPDMTLEQNEADLRRHAEDFARRAGFTYTVLDEASGDVVGCVYIYPARRPGHDAQLQSWVRADYAARDAELRAALRDWLAVAWPFTAVDYHL